MIGFLAVAVVVIVAPGPDFALTVRNAVRGGGARDGVRGGRRGRSVWVVATAAGVAALLAASHPAFVAAASRRRGVSRLARARERSSSRGAHASSLRPGSPYRQGLLSNLANPKMPVFFISLLPQFGGSFVAVTAHGLVFAALTLCWLALVVARRGAAARPARAARRRCRHGRRARRARASPRDRAQVGSRACSRSSPPGCASSRAGRRSSPRTRWRRSRRRCRWRSGSSTAAGAASRTGSRGATRDFGIGPENATSYPHPGELALYPGGQSETELAVPVRLLQLRVEGGAAVGEPLRDGRRGRGAAPAARQADPLGGRPADLVPRALSQGRDPVLDRHGFVTSSSNRLLFDPRSGHGRSAVPGLGVRRASDPSEPGQTRL